MFIAFLINFILLSASLAWTRRYFSREGLTYRLLALGTLFFSQVILILVSWGLAGRLYLGNVVLSGAVIFLLSRLTAGEKSSGGPLCLPALDRNKVAAFVLSFILGFAVVKAVINLVNPPFGWDSLNYHFTFPIEWLKHGNLQNPITINDDLAPTYYPVNGSLVYLWLILPLKNVFLADLGQVPFFVISFLALFGICRLLNIGREYSFYAAGVFSLTPNYFKQLEIAYVDVMVCAWFLSGVYFLLCFLRRRRMPDVILFSLSLGMLIGTKTIALLYGGVLFTLFAAALIRNKNKAISNLSLSLLLIFLIGAYGYIRNLIDTGNPLYPMKVELLGREIFEGVYDKSNYNVRVIPGDYSFAKMLFHEGMGAGAILFVIPGLLYSATYAAMSFLRKRGSISLDSPGKPGNDRITRNEDFLILLVLFLPAILYLIWRYLIPLANLRYLYPAIALGYAAPFCFLQANPRLRIAARAAVVICVLAAASEMASRMELVSSLGLSLLLFLAFKPVYRWISAFRFKGWVITGIIGFLLLHLLNLNYNANEFKRYPKMTKYSGLWPDAVRAWEWLDENTKSDNIAYVGRPVPFPLYGRNFKNNVFYVSVNEVDPVKIHYFPNSRYIWGRDFLELHQSLEKEGNYRRYPDYDIWLGNLERRKTNYLFVYSLHQTKDVIFPLEDSWAKDNSGRFSLVFGNQTVHIYKLIR